MIKSTGMVKQIDDMGRIVIPKDIKRGLGIENKDHMEIFVDDDKIILKKYAPGCVFCGNIETLSLYNGKFICEDCKKQISNLK